MSQSVCPSGSWVANVPRKSSRAHIRLRGRADLVVLISEESEKRRRVTVFSRRFAIVMVWFVTAVCGISFFAATIPDEGYLRAFGWGAVMAGAMFLVGRLGVSLFWNRDEDQGRRRE